MNYLILYYIFSTLIFLSLGENNTLWFLFNVVSILFTLTGVLYNFGHKVFFYKPYFNIAIVLTICRIAYSFACPLAPDEWIDSANIIFSVCFATWMIITIIIRYRGT